MILATAVVFISSILVQTGQIPQMARSQRASVRCLQQSLMSARTIGQSLGSTPLDAVHINQMIAVRGGFLDHADV
jgi:hypothetical protein